MLEALLQNSASGQALFPLIGWGVGLRSAVELLASNFDNVPIQLDEKGDYIAKPFEKPEFEDEHLDHASRALTKIGVDKLRKMLGHRPGLDFSVPIDLGEAWSDALYDFIVQMSATQQQAWMALLEHCPVKSPQVSKRWVSTTGELLAGIDQFDRIAAEFMTKYGHKRTKKYFDVSSAYAEWFSGEHNTLVLLAERPA